MDGMKWSRDDGHLIAMLEDSVRGMSPEEILACAVGRLFPGRIALVSSFGAESAVLLHLLAQVDRATPVIFLDTGKHFPETLSYRDRLVARFGLTDVRSVTPDASEVATADSDGALHARDADACCSLRKISPLDRALAAFAAWITGRKRFQGRTRAALRVFEEDDRGRIKVNPLAGQSAAEIAARFARFRLPAHPLTALGYRSIGCLPCTRPALDGEDGRAGRWAGSGKIECGIHLGRYRRGAEQPR